MTPAMIRRAETTTWAVAIAVLLAWIGPQLLDGPDTETEARDIAAAIAELGTEQQFIHPASER